MQKAVRKEKLKVVEHPGSLRDTLEWLKAQGDLIETDKPVNPDLEVTGLQKHLDGACPMLFNNVKGKPNHRVVTNLFGDMNVINKMFGWADDVERTRKLSYALSHPIKPVEIEQSAAPCQEHVIENPKDVNEYMVPIRHTTYESELTVGSGIRCVTGEHFDGGSDLGYNRMNFRWGNVGTFQISPGSHMWQVVNKYYKAGRAGSDHHVLRRAAGLHAARRRGVRLRHHAAGLRRDRHRRRGAGRADPAGQGAHRQRHGAGRRRDRARRATSIRATAATRPRRSEDADVQGRYHFHPEWAGYMGKAYKAPTFHVTAVTMRKPASKPIIFALGVHTLDEHNIDTTIREATIFELCNRLQPGIVQDVVIPYSMTDWGGCIIQVKKRHQIDEGWQRNFLGAVLSCSQGMRLAIAVSEDVDPYSMDDMMWCLTTRVNPQTDILNPIPGGRGQTFMPAERMTAGDEQWTASNTRFEGGMGIDATVPFGYERTSCARSIRSTR